MMTLTRVGFTPPPPPPPPTTTRPPVICCSARTLGRRSEDGKRKRKGNDNSGSGCGEAEKKKKRRSPPPPMEWSCNRRQRCSSAERGPEWVMTEAGCFCPALFQFPKLGARFPSYPLRCWPLLSQPSAQMNGGCNPNLKAYYSTCH